MSDFYGGDRDPTHSELETWHRNRKIRERLLSLVDSREKERASRARKKEQGKMGKFSGIEDASISSGGVYFLAGKYIVKVKRCFTMRSRKKEDLFIVECEIIESTNEDRPAGTSASWVVNFKQDAALGNIKGFIGAANGLEDEASINAEVTEEVCEYVVSDDNPLAGTVLLLEATDVKTRAGNPFTKHAWAPFSEEEAA